MAKYVLLLILSSTLFFAQSEADIQVWSGQVKAEGQPSVFIPLKEGKKYRIKASGSVNLGKWKQQGKALASDACYEYAEGIEPEKVKGLRNSLEISICDEGYKSNHIYESKPFKAIFGGIHFWVDDIDYNDNSGQFNVIVSEVISE